MKRTKLFWYNINNKTLILNSPRCNRWGLFYIHFIGFCMQKESSK